MLALPEGVALRPITDDDLPFLRRVYGSTREEELAPTGWSEQEKSDFLDMQFRAQHAHYQEHYPGCAFDVIVLDGEDVGRLYLHRTDIEHRVVDIALLPDHRGNGIGGAIMRTILDEAHAAGKPARIFVEKNNPAFRLYERLGFEVVGDEGVYWLMECAAPA